MTSQYKFQENVWISFNYKNQHCIGRSFIDDLKTECVFAISGDELCAFTIPYALIEAPKLLNILAKTDVKTTVKPLTQLPNNQRFMQTFLN